MTAPGLFCLVSICCRKRTDIRYLKKPDGQRRSPTRARIPACHFVEPFLVRQLPQSLISMAETH